MLLMLANMSIEPIITVYISHLNVPTDHLARTAGIVMACSAFGSMLTAARLGGLLEETALVAARRVARVDGYDARRTAACDRETRPAICC